MNLNPSNQLNLFGLESYLLELSKLFFNNKFPNKILLSGQKGIGKSTLSYHLINHFLSHDEEFDYDLKNFRINPKNKSFKLLQNKSHPNFFLIDIYEEKKIIDIKQIRNLILSLNKSSFNNKPRFILIDNIELLNSNAVNALLKIIEEPNDNVNFILINNNKKILSTLKSRCLNFKIHLSLGDAFSVINKILEQNYNDLVSKDLINIYNTPGELLGLINFANLNNIDLNNITLNQLIKKMILDKNYKKDNIIKELIYSLIEIYFRKNISLTNIKLLNLYSYFLKKIDNTKLFNLDDETLFMEFDDKVLGE